MTNKKNTKNSKIGTGLGIAATLAATAVGLYYLYGKNGPKHRKQVKGWMLKVQGEVMDRINKLEEITEDAYYKIVDDVTKQYSKYKDVDTTELSLIATELRDAWKHIQNLAKKQRTKTKTTGTRKSNKKTSA